ncbi:MAG: hypothetical protein ABL862_07470, partial [Candidatus Nitrotoga sp.]
MKYSSGWNYATPSNHRLLHFELESARSFSQYLFKETLNNSQHSRVRRVVSECGVKFCDFCPELRHF